jgi:hypothetical protein
MDEEHKTIVASRRLRFNCQSTFFIAMKTGRFETPTDFGRTKAIHLGAAGLSFFAPSLPPEGMAERDVLHFLNTPAPAVARFLQTYGQISAAGYNDG